MDALDAMPAWQFAIYVVAATWCLATAIGRGTKEKRDAVR